MNLKRVVPRKEAGEKEKLSHHDASHRKRNNFVVGERHNRNANEDKLRRKEAGSDMQTRRGGKALLCLLVTTNFQGKLEAGKPLQIVQVTEVEGSNIAQGRVGKFRISGSSGSLQAKTTSTEKNREGRWGKLTLCHG